MLRESFGDRYDLPKSRHKVITGAPENINRWLKASGLWLLALFSIAYTYHLIFEEIIGLGFVTHALLQFGMLWMVCLMVLLMGCAVFLVRRRSHRLLKILELSERGITLGRFQDSASEAVDYLITWKEISCVEEASIAGGNSVLRIGSKFNITYKLSYENAFGWVKREDLIDSLLLYAPQAKMNLSLPLEQEVSRQLSYTSIWLENFERTGRRRRLGPLEPGERLNENRYEVLRQIGAGGQGKTYVARVLDNTMPHYFEGEVVLKEYVLPNMVSDLRAGGRSSYAEEAMILSKLDHPNIVKIFDSFEEDYRGYLVLEYVRGASMRAQVETSGVCPEGVAREIGLSLCSILSFMHSQNPPIVHGDITPENVMVNNELIKLIDFTVAQAYKQERKSRLAGKKGFVAPEQFEGLTMPESDIYSAGCTLYFILSGLEPDGPQSFTLAQIGAPVSEGMSRIVQKCMFADLERRYSTASQLEHDLSCLEI